MQPKLIYKEEDI